jgi:tRNA threonylcarbamoyladenosine biosynthesis protein TsaE
MSNPVPPVAATGAAGEGAGQTARWGQAVPTTAAMEALGERLAKLLRAGDLVILSGPLGAGKTVLTRGIGAGLAVQGRIISPTFVLSRVHPATGSGPALVHVDAYRLAAAAEIDDLDLDSSLADSVTVVEWGEGLADQLSGDRLDITIERSGDLDDDTRQVWVHPHGQRWHQTDWQLLDQPATTPREAARG